MKNNTYIIITIGCQMNKSDSERIAGYLESHDFKRARKGEQPGLAVLVTCGVRQSAEDRIYGIIPLLRKENPDCRIILTGCLAIREDVKRRIGKSVDLILPIDLLPSLHMLIKGKKADEKACIPGAYLSITPSYSSAFSAFVPIGNGCDNFCSYCVVPDARGREHYRPAGEIIDEVKELVERGYKEIMLIAQNVNSYNQIKNHGRKAIGNLIDFKGLLKEINELPGDFWLRFATNHPKDMDLALITAIGQYEKVCRHIHLPVQSGDDKVLSKMNRRYTAEKYLALLDEIRQVLPDAAITTDIIVGFPGETRKAFANTKKLLMKARFDLAYIAQYSPRPGTAAYRLTDDVPQAEKKRREEELLKILRNIALKKNKKYVGSHVRVLIEKKGKGGALIGRTAIGKTVVVHSANKRASGIRIGEFSLVLIESAKDFGLTGKLE